VSNPEIVAITRALLALSTAVRETQRAVFLLKTPGNDDVQKALDLADSASGECLEYLAKLIALIGRPVTNIDIDMLRRQLDRLKPAEVQG